MQSFGSKQLDASLLQIPTVGFLPISDPRVKSTIAAIERRLVRGGFVMRYDTEETDDGLPPTEGAFLACSFWLVDVYILQGRIADAERLFRNLIALRNDLGLLSEEYDQQAKRLVGNFPQALTHLALVNTALYDHCPEVVAALCRAYPALQPTRLAGHSDIAPGRKTDPGVAFDWPLAHRSIAAACTTDKT